MVRPRIIVIWKDLPTTTPVRIIKYHFNPCFIFLDISSRISNNFLKINGWYFNSCVVFLKISAKGLFFTDNFTIQIPVSYILIGSLTGSEPDMTFFDRISDSLRAWGFRPGFRFRRTSQKIKDDVTVKILYLINLVMIF